MSVRAGVVRRSIVGRVQHPPRSGCRSGLRVTSGVRSLALTLTLSLARRLTLTLTLSLGLRCILVHPQGRRERRITRLRLLLLLRTSSVPRFVTVTSVGTAIPLTVPIVTSGGGGTGVVPTPSCIPSPTPALLTRAGLRVFLPALSLSLWLRLRLHVGWK
jgi:hypothetical protein